MLALLSALGLAACGDEDPFTIQADGSFGTNVPGYASDGGLDGGGLARDAGAGASGPTVRVRFLHGIPNTGTLLVCHDPDGPGPIAAHLLSEQATLLRAEYGTRSAPVTLPAITSGTLSLQREARSTSGDAGFDAGPTDGGAPADPCAEATREALIELPISTTEFADDPLELLPTLSGASSVTLLGTGVALDSRALEQRTPAERGALESAFGATALIQRDPDASNAQAFSLAAFHAIPDVPPADPLRADREVGAVRLCITAGTRDTGVQPKPPAPGMPFRVTTPIGDSYDARLTYDVRVFAQGAFDSQNKDCATTGLMPIAKGSFSKFQPGHAYTLALLGAISPTALCSSDDVSIVRASCSPAALAAKLVLLED